MENGVATVHQQGGKIYSMTSGKIIALDYDSDTTNTQWNTIHVQDASIPRIETKHVVNRNSRPNCKRYLRLANGYVEDNIIGKTAAESSPMPSLNSPRAGARYPILVVSCLEAHPTFNCDCR